MSDAKDDDAGVTTPPCAVVGRHLPAGTTPMAVALRWAADGALAGEVPVGAVVLAADGTVLAMAHNRVERDRDPTAHAEIVALRQAAMSLGTAKLAGCSLHVTLEPCPMCAHAISLARISRLVFGALDPKSGGVESGPRVLDATTAHHRPEIHGGVGAQASASLLRAFFAPRR